MAESDSSLTTMDWLSAVKVKITPNKSEFLDSSLSLTSPSSSRDPQEDFSMIEREGGKPSYSYSTLIKFAITSSRSKRMSLRQIYKWISDNFPYYKDARNGWKNSVRHNLSLNKCFVKVPRDKGDMGKGCYWSLREDAQQERHVAATPAMRAPVISVTAVGHAPSQQQHVVMANSRAFGTFSGVCAAVAQPPAPVSCGGVGAVGFSDGLPELTDSSAGVLAALMGSQSDQVLGAAFAPATSAVVQGPPPSSAPPQQQQVPLHQHGQVSYEHQQHLQAPLTPPPPPLSPPSGDQLGLSSSLQTICRSLLGESSSGSSGLGAFASAGGGSVAGGNSATGGSTSGGGSGGAGSSSCQLPDLSASTLDFVQRMLPQLKESFQLSDSALHDLWGHCRSTSRPPVTTAASSGASPGQGPTGGAIPLPTAALQRQPPGAQPPAPHVQQPRPLQPQPSAHRQAADAGQDVEDDFNWDSIL